MDELFGANTDPANPKTLANLLSKLDNVSLESLWNDMQVKIKDKLTAAIARSTVELTAKFVPGVGNIAGLIQTIFAASNF